MGFKPSEKTMQKINAEKEPELISVRTFKRKKSDDNDSEANTNDLAKVPDLVKSELPIFEIKELPSGFKVYPNLLKEKAYYKPYSWNGVKKLNQSKLPTLAVWDFILSGIESTFDLELLTIQDFFYIALLRRLSTVGQTKFTVTLACKNKSTVEDKEYECGFINSFTIKDSQIAYDDFSLDPEQLPVKILVRNKWYEFTPLTIKDARFLMKEDKFDDSNAQIAVQCRNADFEEIYNLLNSEDLSFQEGQYFDQLELLFYHGILPIEKNSETNEALVCESCKKPIKVFLDGGGTIIRPFRGLEVDSGGGICFGVQNESKSKTD